MFEELIIICAMVFSSITDIKYKKVFNYVTFPLMITGIIYNLIFYGGYGLKKSLMGIIMSFLIFMIINIIVKNIGFGDVKLMMGVGAYLGWQRSLEIYIVSIFLFIIVRVILSPKEILEAIKKIYYLVSSIFLSKKIRTIDFKSSGKVYSFVPCLLIGYSITLVLRYFYNLNLLNIIFNI